MRQLTMAYLGYITCIAVSAGGLFPGHLKAYEVCGDTETNADHRLLLFCHSAKLFDRGIAESVFSGPVDQRIVEQLRSNVGFQDLLKLSDDQNRLLVESVRADVRNPDDEGTQWRTILDAEGLAPGYFERLQRILTDAQYRQLAPIYLRLEGLMALRRPCFGEIIGVNPKQRQRIAQLSDRYLEEKALPIQRAIFVLPNGSYKRPDLQLALRMVSVELDLEILSILKHQQQEALVAIVEQANKSPDITMTIR